MSAANYASWSGDSVPYPALFTFSAAGQLPSNTASSDVIIALDGPGGGNTKKVSVTIIGYTTVFSTSTWSLDTWCDPESSQLVGIT